MKAIDISRHFVFLASKDPKYNITCLKLQKLLYYGQGYSLIWEGKELFEDEIEAWKHGAVVPEVYNAFKQYGALNIPEKEGIEIISPRAITLIIEKIWETYKEYGGFELAKRTQEERPWIDTMAKKTLVINKDLIKDYFYKAYR